MYANFIFNKDELYKKNHILNKLRFSLEFDSTSMFNKK